MTDPDIVADQLQELSRQVRWLRHAVERLLVVLGLLCGAGLIAIFGKIVLQFGS